MEIAVIGTGYVGLVSGACFAEMGNRVTCVDVDQTKIDNLKQGILPIYEPGLDTIVDDNVKAGRLLFTTSLPDAIAEAEACFIAVGTPPGEDGSADLQYVLAVAEEIGQHLQRYLLIVDKSTVPVGTAEKVSAAGRRKQAGQNIEATQSFLKKVMPLAILCVPTESSSVPIPIALGQSWKIFTRRLTVTTSAPYLWACATPK